MAREQGDEMNAEVVYVRPEDNDDRERRAFTPADHVNLQARGWVRRDEQKSTKGRRAAAKAAPDAANS